MVRLQPRPNVRKEKPPAKTDVQLSETEISGTSDSEGTESREAKLVEKTGGSHEDSGNSGEIPKDRSPVVLLDEDSDSGDEAFYDAISFDGDDGDEDSPEVVEAEPSTAMCSYRLLLPVRRLEKAYVRCMQMSVEELSLEPAVYIHEGNVLLAQLRDELAMLPELQELSPECDISKADVGEPGRTTPAEDEKLRMRLSLPKSEFGKLSILYLSHEISAEGIRAVPKIAKGIQDLPFLKTLKGVQSFLGSLNYYHKLIEDFPVVAAVLYELSDDQVRSERDLTRAKVAFEILKKKIVSTPLLHHPDRSKPFVTIPHANRWAACAVLGQEHVQPVRFTGRVLNDAELRYHVAEKEMIAGLRVLQVFRTLLEVCSLEVYTRHSVFKWILQSKTADGRCVPWGVILSNWDITVRKVQRDEDGLAAIMGAGITPREHLDEVAESLIPDKGRVWKPPVLSVEMLDDTYQGIVLGFDGAAKTSTRRGSCGCILWQLPGWKVLEARDSRIVIQQVQGLINCHQTNLQKHLAECEVQKEKFRKLHLVHVKREYNQAADYLTSKTLTLGKFWTVQDPEEFLHLERVSMIAEKLMKPKVVRLDGDLPQDSERQSLPKGSVGDVADSQSAPRPQAARVFAVLTRSTTQARTLPSQEVIEDALPDEEAPMRPMTPLEYQAERWRRIRVHQEQDTYLSEIQSFLKGDIGRFPPRRLRKIYKVADLFALDA
ncbi:unnamed protein product [Phytophthora fragariaefolia]|uniref:Unnamed protein product n=1 Tax=Phytophthora fragariaefolia TaxID=1490495 RepID=A0A9W6X971_9STRA|nr:unnamed protein product [Phytophthora fragariaefolia]